MSHSMFASVCFTRPPKHVFWTGPRHWEQPPNEDVLHKTKHRKWDLFLDSQTKPDSQKRVSSHSKRSVYFWTTCCLFKTSVSFVYFSTNFCQQNLITSGNEKKPKLLVMNRKRTIAVCLKSWNIRNHQRHIERKTQNPCTRCWSLSVSWIFATMDVWRISITSSYNRRAPQIKTVLYIFTMTTP